jgi:hypothetical protein
MRHLCKDCLYLMFGGMCAEPDNTDVISGRLILQSCYDMRNEGGGRCGWEARLFMPAPEPHSHFSKV